MICLSVLGANERYNVLKVIYLHQYFNTPDMSGGTRSYEMARRMVAAGHEVHMVTSTRDPNHRHAGWFVSEEAGIQIHWYPVPYSNDMSYAQRMAAFWSFAIAARKKAIQLEGDVVFATSTPLTIALPAVPAARKKKIPMVFEVRDLWPEMPIAIGALNNPLLRFAARRLEHWAYKNSAAVVALSPGMKAGVVATGYPAERVAVIPNSSDNRDFAFDAEAARQFAPPERGWEIGLYWSIREPSARLMVWATWSRSPKRCLSEALMCVFWLLVVVLNAVA